VQVRDPFEPPSLTQPHDPSRPIIVMMEHLLSPTALQSQPLPIPRSTPQKNDVTFVSALDIETPREHVCDVAVYSLNNIIQLVAMIDNLFASDYAVIWLVDYNSLALFYQIEDYSSPFGTIHLGTLTICMSVCVLNHTGADALLQQVPVLVPGYRRELNLCNPFLSHETKNDGTQLIVSISITLLRR